jgi:bacterial/archaeal transporter family-2 protein
MSQAPAEPRLIDIALAFASGGILTLMTMFNGAVSLATTPLFASWTAHGIGGVAALGVLAAVRRRPAKAATPTARAPLWAYLGGLCGAATVVLTSLAVNSALALTGTIALTLAGQAAFALMADRFGLFGLARRTISLRDLAAVALVLAGSGLILAARGG